MVNITIELTDTQYKSLEYCSFSPQDWVENAANARAQIAKEEIVQKLVEHCNTNNIAIETGADAQVAQAYSLGVVKTSAEMDAEFVAQVEAEATE